MLLCGCMNQSVNTLVIPDREMSIYRLESRIERLESYSKEETKAECDMLRRQIDSLKRAMASEKANK